MLIVLSAACSRPVAYFQKSQRESFAVKTNAPAATITETNVSAVTEPTVAVETPAVQAAQATAAFNQLDAMVSTNSKLAADKSLQKRMNRVKVLLATATQKSAVAGAANVTSVPHKMNLMERTVLKKMNKKIKNHLAPEKPMAKSMLTIGLIIGIIGLLLIILNVASPLGIIALVAGLILVLVDLLR